ncbi:MAG: GntR family transcriptional regulator [Granulosicoccus sp.]|nr:GntR family transcriptional regulator [Granulosicoccus sp.]
MHELSKDLERRTATDVVFEHLQDEILSLRLLPGAKLSEVETAQKFGVSRQPVRDAFNRLCHLNLLLIRPQKATLVRGISAEKIEQARFIRLAIEVEVVKNASLVWDKKRSKKIQHNLEQQHRCVSSEYWDDFHSLDFQFHKLICELGNCPVAIDTIAACKLETDRLCKLSFDREREVETVLEDHIKLVNALEMKDADLASDIIRVHLSRLDSVIDDIRVTHAEYFE